MFERFKTRSHQLERIDTGDYTAAEYARWQREMPLIHGFLGENRALRNSLLNELQKTAGQLSLLDVGAGSGEMLTTVRGWLDGREPLLVGVEINNHAAVSIKAAGHLAVRCDALHLPFGDDSFDHAFCTLTFHHLGDAEAVRLMGEMGRVSRGRIYVVDLNRNPAAYYAYRTFAPLMFQRLTVEDGALSILRSFTADELYEVATKAGLSNIRVERSRLNRLVLSGSKT